MYVKKLKIHNFKRFRDYTFCFQQGLNILIGNNEVGKSTIMEAIYLAMTGFYKGKYLRSAISQYLFNVDAVNEYRMSFENNETPIAPPSLWIELYFDDCPVLEGNHNSDTIKEHGLRFELSFDSTFNAEYEQLIANKKIYTLPIEYYKVEWSGFSREAITARSIPIKALMIDSSIYSPKDEDVYLSHLLKNSFDDDDKLRISQAYRKTLDAFMEDQSMKDVNDKLASMSNLSVDEAVSLGVDLSSANAWEDAIVARLNEVPLSYMGRGTQSEIKTKLALAKKSQDMPMIVMIEEPENHLSFSRLNKLLYTIQQNVQNQQVLISTHSSFVLNKLGLSSLLLLSDDNQTKFVDLSQGTLDYFKKLSGYDTLRMILAKKTILVEGDSDELVVQKCYYQHFNRLPIEDGIDVQCVHGLSFLRYLEIAEKLNLTVDVITDNDGNIERLKAKYAEYIGENEKQNIRIHYAPNIYDMTDFNISAENSDEWKDFNFNTLEPHMLKSNNLDLLNKILGTNYDTDAKLLKHMHTSKAEIGLHFFETNEILNFPKYITDAMYE